MSVNTNLSTSASNIPVSPTTNKPLKLEEILNSDLTPNTKFNKQKEFFSQLANEANSKMSQPTPLSSVGDIKTGSSSNLSKLADIGSGASGVVAAVVPEASIVSSIVDKTTEGVQSLKETLKNLMVEKKGTAPSEIADFLNSSKGKERDNYSHSVYDSDSEEDSPKSINSMSSDEFIRKRVFGKPIKPNHRMAAAPLAALPSLAELSECDTQTQPLAIVLTPPKFSSIPGIHAGVTHLAECDGSEDGI